MDKAAVRQKLSILKLSTLEEYARRSCKVKGFTKQKKDVLVEKCLAIWGSHIESKYNGELEKLTNERKSSTTQRTTKVTVTRKMKEWGMKLEKDAEVDLICKVHHNYGTNGGGELDWSTASIKVKGIVQKVEGGIITVETTEIVSPTNGLISPDRLPKVEEIYDLTFQTAERKYYDVSYIPCFSGSRFTLVTPFDDDPVYKDSVNRIS